MADATKAFTVVTSVKHDGTRYAKGEQIKLTQAQAAPLLANGAITAGKTVAKAAATDIGAGDKTAE